MIAIQRRIAGADPDGHVAGVRFYEYAYVERHLARLDLAAAYWHVPVVDPRATVEAIADITGVPAPYVKTSGRSIDRGHYKWEGELVVAPRARLGVVCHEFAHHWLTRIDANTAMTSPHKRDFVWRFDAVLEAVAEYEGLTIS